MHTSPHEHEITALDELASFLNRERFASMVAKQLGQALHDRLVEWPFEDETEYSRNYPVSALFLWLDRDRIALDPEWLKTADGTYINDQGEVIPSSVKAEYTPAEQMAVYGLWLLLEHAHQWGKSWFFDPPDWRKHLEQHGVTAAEVEGHAHACLLYGYQAALYANRLERLDSPSQEELARLPEGLFAKLGAKGGKAKHESMYRLRDWALERYRSREWKSANDAAHKLAEDVIAHGRTINATLSASNAQRTIAEWFRHHDRSPAGRQADTSGRHT